MTDNEFQLFLTNQERFAEEHRRMAEDISEIKIAVKEAAQIFNYMQRNLDAIGQEVEKLKRAQLDCPARKRAESWGLSAKDLAWLLAFAGGIAALYAATK
jgi:hypothetical protein